MQLQSLTVQRYFCIFNDGKEFPILLHKLHGLKKYELQVIIAKVQYVYECAWSLVYNVPTKIKHIEQLKTCSESATLFCVLSFVRLSYTLSRVEGLSAINGKRDACY